MREKICEIPIDRPLTSARRKAIDTYIVNNRHLAPRNITVTHDWDEETSQVLRIKTPPVSWEVAFQKKIVEIYGSAPLWARLLFTKEKRLRLKEQIELLLHHAGFVVAKPVGVKVVAGLRRPK